MELRAEITPNNILLIGPSGCGKTVRHSISKTCRTPCVSVSSCLSIQELAKRLSKFAGAPFVKAVATKYTEVGFVGGD